MLICREVNEVKGVIEVIDVKYIIEFKYDNSERNYIARI